VLVSLTLLLKEEDEELLRPSSLAPPLIKVSPRRCRGLGVGLLVPPCKNKG
jgi:hypothetical protein